MSRIYMALVSATPDSSRWQRACDNLVTGGILFLVLFTPLAFGTVHPWAFSLMEVVVFLLVIVWVGRLVLETWEPEEGDTGERKAERTLGRLLLPLALFLAFVFLQLLPLPPSLLRALSPATYEVYVHSLPGWPERMPYESIESVASMESVESEEHSLQPSTPNSELRTPNSSSALWRSLSVAPQLTSTNLLKFVAYTSLLLVVLCYPFGSSRSSQRSAASGQPQSEEWFFRTVLLTVLCSGLLVAVLGIVQQPTWNGKILWFFVPYGWDGPHPETLSSASGPFINPDHFANYLALIFPLALVGTLAEGFGGRHGRARTWTLGGSGAERFLCGVIAFTVLIGLILSLSRGGWLAAGVGVGILVGLLLSTAPESRLLLLRQPKGLIIRFASIAGVLFVILALLFVGPAGRSQLDTRLEQTVTQERSLYARGRVWVDSVGMIRDFPWLGVGLGAWPELFPRYRRPPWSRIFYVETHNDYLELFTEAGLLGFGLLAWFFFLVGRQLYRSRWTVSPRIFPVFAALVAALGSMAFHEFFDFSLQIPANAFLFTLLLALALRLTKSTVDSPRSVVHSRLWMPVLVSVGAIVVALCVFAFRQGGAPYPFNLEEPASLVETKERLYAYPAHSSLHRDFVFLAQDQTTPADWLNEFASALWLDPFHPYTRDLYAMVLENQGREEEALQEIARSVSFAPSHSVHLYLSDKLIPSLSEEKQQAVEDGFRRAVASGYEGAVEGLGSFYTVLRRFTQAGKLYEEAAWQEQETERQLRYLLNAGLVYARADEMEKAEALLRQVTTLAPQDPRAYQYLATRVFAPKGDVASAKEIVSAGKKMGADSLSLSLSLAEAAQKIGNLQEAKAALREALTLRHSSFDANLRLGLVYLQEKNFDRAMLMLRKATKLHPDEASAFYYLGMAEEGRYQFFAAQQAYARAIELAPDNIGYQGRYRALQLKAASDLEKKG